MDSNTILRIIMEHLVQAQKDLQECKRGANYGRVAALTELVNAIEQEAKK